MLKKWITNYSEHHDNLISEFYWKKRYNSKCLELESLKEVMCSDIYKKVVKNMVDPMENKRLNRLLEAARDERDYYKNQVNKKIS